MTDPKIEWARAQDEVRAFFEACVPKSRWNHFNECAQKRFNSLWEESQQLKTTLKTATQMDAGITYAANRYVVVSKELIRRTSFELQRKVWPK
jgi:hypothetical protein